MGRFTVSRCRDVAEFISNPRSPVFAWSAALVLPFLMVELLLFACQVHEIRHLFDGPHWIAKQLLQIAIVLAPSFGYLWSMRPATIERFPHIFLFTLVSAIMVPILWLWALWSSCAFFGDCL
jgi:hypothetical protein